MVRGGWSNRWYINNNCLFLMIIINNILEFKNFFRLFLIDWLLINKEEIKHNNQNWIKFIMEIPL